MGSHSFLPSFPPPPPPCLVLPTTAQASPPAPDASAWPFRARSTHVSEPSIKPLTALRCLSPEEEPSLACTTPTLSKYPVSPFGFLYWALSRCLDWGKLWGSAVKIAGTPETKVYFLPNQTRAVLFAPDAVIAKKIPAFSSKLPRKGSDQVTTALFFWEKTSV